MFRPQKSSAERGAETIDFRFLQFRATNVPNGWDKLIVNIISMETGKAIAKTNKALVHKGSCQWSEDVSESACFLQDDNSSELEDKLYKFVVSMGSARSGILGEATINLADYLNSMLLVRIPLPLKRCNHGTILHVKLQCLTPREGPRDSGWRKTALDQAEYISVSEEVDDGSEGSDNFTAGKIGPSSSHHFSALQQVQSATKQAHGSMSPRKLQKDGVSSAATSQYGSDSIEMLSVTGSAMNRNPEDFALPRRQHSAGSLGRSATNRAGNNHDQYGSSHSSFTGNGTATVDRLENLWQDRATEGSYGAFQGGIGNTNRGMHMATLAKGSASSKELLKAAEETIQELRTEAMIWERNAQQSVLEAETLKQQLAEQARQHKELEVEFSVTQAERNNFKQEVEQLNSTLQAYIERERGLEDVRFEIEDARCTIQELQEELELQKESNVNLSLQLKKTQESNIELVFALQELEETIEKQNVEIEKLSEAREKLFEMELSKQQLEDMRRLPESELEVSAVMTENDCFRNEVEQLKSTLEAVTSRQSFANAVRSDAEDAKDAIKELQRNIKVEKEFNEKLNFEMQQADAFKQELLSNVRDPDENVIDQAQTKEHLSYASKVHAVQERQAKQTTFDIEKSWMQNICFKEEQIKILMAKILNFASHLSLTEVTEDIEESQENLHEYLKSLRREIHEFERDCKKLIDENLELIYMLKKLYKNLESKNTYIAEVEKKLQGSLKMNALMHITTRNTGVDMDGLKAQVTNLDQKMIMSETLYTAEPAGMETSHCDFQTRVEEVQNHEYGLESKLYAFKGRIHGLEDELQRAYQDRVEMEGELAAAYEHRLEVNEARAKKAEHELANSEKRIQTLEFDNPNDSMVTHLEQKLELSDNLDNADLARMEQSISEFQKLVMDLQNQKSGLESSVNMFKERVHALENEVQTAQQETIQRETELRTAYEHKLESNEARAAKLEDKFLDALQIIQTFEANKAKDAIEIVGLKDQVAQLEHKLKSCEDLYSAEFASMESSLHDFQTHVMELQNEKLDMESNINAFKKRVEEVENELQTTQRETIKRESESAAAYEHRLEATEARANKAEHELADALQRVETFESGNRRALIEMDQLKAQIIQLNQKLKSSEIFYSAELTGMEKSLEDFQNQALKLQTQNSGLESDLNFSKKIIHELESKLQTTQYEYEHQLEANEARVTKAEDERANALQTVQALQFESTKDAIEIQGLKGKVSQLQQRLTSAENSYSAEVIGMGKSLSDCQNQVMELLNQNSGLENKVNILVERVHELENEVQTGQAAAVEGEKELTTAYEQRLECMEAKAKKAEYELAFALWRIQTFESDNMKNEMAEIISQQQKQRTVEDQATTVQDELTNPQKTIAHLEADNERMKIEVFSEFTKWQNAENLLNGFQMLNGELQTTIQETEGKHSEACLKLSDLLDNISQLQKQPCRYSLVEKNLPETINWLENVKMEPHSEIYNFQKGHAGKSGIEGLGFQFLMLTEDIQSTSSSEQDFDMQNSKLQMEKPTLHGSECLDFLAKQLRTLTVDMKSIAFTTKDLKKKAMELEHGKEAIGSHLRETREKNIHMSKQICNLEYQLRNMAKERDSYKLNLENIKDHLFDLQAGEQNLGLKLREENGKRLQGLHKLENKLSGPMKDIDFGKEEQQKLQLNSEKLTKEHAAVQESKLAFEKKSFNLFQSLANLEECLQYLTQNLEASVKQIKYLELKLSSLNKEMTDKERIWAADTEAYDLSRKEYEEKVVKAGEAIRQACSEKASAVESLQYELQSLTSQLSSIFNEKQKALSEASELCAENVKYQDSLQQIQANVIQSEAEFPFVKQESKTSVQELMLQLNVSKQNEEDLDLKLEIGQRQLEDMKGREADLWKRVPGLEMKGTDVENERQRHKEEDTGLNSQAHQLVNLCAEMDSLQRVVEDLRTENSTLKHSLHSASAELETLKAENILLMENLAILQKGTSDVDKIKQSKTVLEERILCLQAELSSKEVASICAVEQVIESLRIKRLNSQFQCKLQDLQHEKEEFKNKGQSIEEELQLKMDELSNAEQKYLSNSNSNVGIPSPSQDTNHLAEFCKKIQVIESEWNIWAEEFEEREKDLCTKIENLESVNQQLLQAQLDSDTDQLKMELIRLQKQNFALAQQEHEFMSKLAAQELFQKEVQRLQEVNEQLQIDLTRFKETVKRGDILDRVVTLETELAEALESNSMYKSQLRRFLCDEQNVHAATLQNFGTIDHVINDLVSYKRKASTLEEDLNDMRKRYSNLSLQLAEVEAQREELVMTLKNAKYGTRRSG